MKRALSLVLSLILVLALLPASTALADSQAYGQEVWLRSAAIGDGVVYSENIFWSGGYDKPRHEYYFTYSPAGGLSNLPAAPFTPPSPEDAGGDPPPADEVVNTRDVDFGKALLDAFGPDKADVIYDCAGNDITMDQAIQNARKGSMIVLVAVFAGQAHCDLAKLNDSELDLNTSMMYRHEDYVDAIRLVGEGKIQLKPLMSRHFAFQDYLAAYQYIDGNRENTMKVLMDVDPSEE